MYNVTPTTLIFDLSEVLIAGLVGVEKILSSIMRVGRETILPAFAENGLHDLFCGKLSEDEYFAVHYQTRDPLQLSSTREWDGGTGEQSGAAI